MPTILIPNMTKGMNQGAFGSALLCPFCSKSSWKFVERISTFRIRYRCNDCQRTIQYDYSNNSEHPYAVFGKSKWRRIMEQWKQKTGHASLDAVGIKSVIREDRHT